jgi:hypothetical protein
MPSKHVVTFDPRDGSYSCLRAKKGQGLDLRKLGEVEVKRVSHIVWDENEQAWFVQVIDRIVRDWIDSVWADGEPGELLWLYWVAAHGHNAVLDRQLEFGDKTPKGGRLSLGRLLFEDYEDAVAAEVAFLDALRLKGIVPE